MFTGLVQKVGLLRKLTRSAGGWCLVVESTPWEEPLVLGESVAVQGACLTVVEVRDDGFTADLLDETLARTALGGIASGARLNLERALRLGDRLGGHLVSGHIDETGYITTLKRQGRDMLLGVSCSSGLTQLMVPKGSIAIDGISLTIVSLEQETFSVAIIPHTWSETSLNERRIGDKVNLEADMVGKHVARLVLALNPSGSAAKRSIDEGFLRQTGFI